MRKKNRSLFLLLLFLFMILTQYRFFQSIDENIVLAVEKLREERFDFFMYNMTKIGSFNITFLLTVIFFIFFVMKGKKREGFFLFINFWGVRFLNQFLKQLFLRERPNFHPLIEVGEYSFPSGHTMNSTAIYGLIAYFFVQHQYANKKWVIFLFSVLIFLIGFSRVYLGVHYVSDVLAGFLAGSFWLLFIITILEKVRQK
ncbi:phosphatase PAP2 family protein [Bacillus alveayuensis]|uniref:phosphatase PAP2 family protein n=1 Tax=Aeribacillus alveayuensis TaxID=279215 RepID=UPI000698B715|nr:phosphatase PAP2 family protein [Bacillus alveayuensis]